MKFQRAILATLLATAATFAGAEQPKNMGGNIEQIEGRLIAYGIKCLANREVTGNTFASYVISMIDRTTPDEKEMHKKISDMVSTFNTAMKNEPMDPKTCEGISEEYITNFNRLVENMKRS